MKKLGLLVPLVLALALSACNSSGEAAEPSPARPVAVALSARSPPRRAPEAEAPGKSMQRLPPRCPRSGHRSSRTDRSAWPSRTDASRTWSTRREPSPVRSVASSSARRPLKEANGAWSRGRSSSVSPPRATTRRLRVFDISGKWIARREWSRRLPGVRRPPGPNTPAAGRRGAAARAPQRAKDVPAALAVQSQLSQVQLDLERPPAASSTSTTRLPTRQISLALHEAGIVRRRTAGSASSTPGRPRARPSWPSSAGSSSGSPSSLPLLVLLVLAFLLARMLRKRSAHA